jgi:hypothetical protein
MGTNKLVTPISRTVVSPGDDPKHELVVLDDQSTYHHEFGP